MKAYYLLFFAALPYFSYSQIIESDSLALIEIYNALGGDDWTNNEGWLTESPLEDWNGIKVTGDRVTEVRLLNIGVEGTFPEAIYELTGLSSLSIFIGNVTGELSEDINNLTSLRVLALERLALTGTIPDLDGFSELDNIRLSENELTGPLPNLPLTANLVRMNGNNLSGEVPSSWEGLPNLNVLNISNNMLTGSMDIFETIVNIGSLNLAINEWDEGPLPDWLDDLPSLRLYICYECNLTGDVPVYDFSNSPNFDQILIDDNQLTGDISNLLHGISDEYVWLDASYNNFEGELPLDKFQNVGKLDLSGNAYSTLATPNTPSLSEINLSTNKFKISTLLPHLNEYPIDSMESLRYNNQATYFEKQDTTFTTPQTVILDAGDTYDGMLYQWILGNQSIEGETNSTIEIDATTPLGNKRYNCIMTHPDLTDKLDRLIEFKRGELNISTNFTPTSVQDISINISAYPNPTTDFISIKVDDSSLEFPYSIISTFGTLVKSGITNAHNPVDLQDVESGIYTIQLDMEGKIYRQSIIKL